MTFATRSGSPAVSVASLGQGDGRLRHRAGEPSVDPRLDVRRDGLLADVIQEIVEVALVELQRLVLRTGQVVEALASRRPRCLVGGAVEDQDGQCEFREVLRQAVRALRTSAEVSAGWDSFSMSGS